MFAKLSAELMGTFWLVLGGCGAAVLALYAWHVVRRHPRPTRNLVAGVSEASTAGNAIATPVAVASIDPSLLAVQESATAQVAAAVVTTAFTAPFLVAYVAAWQRRRGVTPEAEEALYVPRETELALEREPLPQLDPQRV